MLYSVLFLVMFSILISSRTLLKLTKNGYHQRFLSMQDKTTVSDVGFMVPSGAFLLIYFVAYTLTYVLIQGVIAVYKPMNWTSTDVVNKIKFILGCGARDKYKLDKKLKIKVGHGGTLDPLAEGVLVIGIGKGTKLMEQYLASSKSYEANCTLGSETDTLDITGEIVETIDASHVTNEIIIDKLKQFEGEILQIPPMYSALKINGQRLYDLARAGTTVERKPRKVTAYESILLNSKLPDFTLKISCSGGFYVRSLISDLGRACNTRAHMTGLLRTKQGKFQLNDCLYKNEWEYANIVAHIEKYNLIL